MRTSKIQMAVREHQNGRQGQERGLILGFIVYPSTFGPRSRSMRKVCIVYNIIVLFSSAWKNCKGNTNRDTQKIYETYNRIAWVLFYNKCLRQVTLSKFKKDKNQFDLDQSEDLSNYFGLSQSHPGYPNLSRYDILCNHRLPWVVSINNWVSSIKYRL